MYAYKDLVSIAKRENNKKRKYLVANPVQGKHIPAVPGESLRMFHELAEICKAHYGDERLLLVGFAETATAIGAAVAVELSSKYIQTTREIIPGAEYIYFYEEHSHATEQKLVKEDIEKAVDDIDRIIFVDDEITTGRTIMNAMDALEMLYPDRLTFSAVSVLNGMNEAALQEYNVKNINIHYLMKVNNESYTKLAESFRCDGVYINADLCGDTRRNIGAAGNEYGSGAVDINIRGANEIEAVPDGRCGVCAVSVGSWMDARRLVDADAYCAACSDLWQGINEQIDFNGSDRILVLGTEEFMYPAMYTAWQLEMSGKEVIFHASTRSPMEVSSEKEYPVHTRYRLKSLYDAARTTYIYNLGRYDMVLIITDAQADNIDTDNRISEGELSLVNALASCGNKNIIIVRWCRD